MSKPPHASPDALFAEASWVHRLARHLIRDEHLAADVAQDALLAGMSAPVPATTEPRGWLVGTVRRLAQQALRRRAQRAALDRRIAAVGAEDPEARALERLRLHELLTRSVRELPEPYRTVVAMRFFEGRPPRAIARLRGQTAAAVRQQIHRGLALLRQRLDGEFGERHGWIAALVGLGFGSPFVPGLPIAITWPTLATAALAALAFAVVAMVWTTSRRAVSPPTPPVALDAPAWSPVDFQTAPTVRGIESPPTPGELRTRVREYLAALNQMGLFAGTALIARGDDILVHEAIGLADRAAGTPNSVATRFKLMSTGKSLTAVALFRLVQAGKLALTDPLARHLPDVPAAWREVTIHDLLDHTSGIPNLEVEWGLAQNQAGARGLPVWPQFARSLGERALLAPPGNVSAYSNFNFELVGLVAETAAGLPFPELLRQQVLEPAGMQETGFDDGSRPSGLALGYFFGDPEPTPSAQDMSVIRAAGGLWSTVADLHRFARALHGERLLGRELQQVMQTPRGQGFAAGWHVLPVLGHACVQHSGGANGYVAQFLRFPDADATIAVLSNYAFAPSARIAVDLAGLLFGADRPLPRAATDAELAAAVGTFAAAEGPRRMVVRRAGATLMVFEFWPGNDRIGGRLLIPAGDARFLSVVGDGEYRLFGEEAQTPWDKLTRCDAATAAWRTCVGDWQVDPQFGTAATIALDGDRLRLSLCGGWPEGLEIVPVGADQAMVMAMPDFGTRLRRDGDDLVWARADGRTISMRRGQ